MASMNVSLPDPMRAFVQSRIDDGRYASVSDYVRDLIRRDQAEDADTAAWLHGLDVSIAQGLADVEAGQVRDFDIVCDEVIATIRDEAGAGAA